MNWGTKIILGLVSFMVFITVLGLLMVNSKTDGLVDTDYYEQGINYNKVYNRKEQMLTDRVQPVIAANTNLIVVSFIHPSKGTARLIRSSDKELDQVIPFESNLNNQLIIPATEIKKGKWKLVIEWTSQEKSYLYDQDITL